jgi:methanogenic corrinoid protein MtbC1
VIEAALASGADIEEIYLDVLAPALISIGERWATGDLCVTIEHRASGIASRIVGRLGPRFARRGRTRGLVIVGAPEGEQHSLPVSMLADLLRHRGWEVSDLGADVPTTALGQFVALADADLVAVGLSVSTAQYLPSLAHAIGVVRESAPPSVCILAGGSAVADADHAHALGADAFAEDGREFGSLLDALRPTG